MKQKYQYAVTVVRFDEDDSSTELIDQWVTADDAIELMMHIRDNIQTLPENEQEEEETEGDDTEVEKEEEKQPERKNGTNAGKVRHDYDKEEAKKDIIAGLTPGVIAEKHDVPVTTIYTLKNKMKNNGELSSDVKPKPVGQIVDTEINEHGFSATIEPPVEESRPKEIQLDGDTYNDIAEAVHDGESLDELINSFPSVPLPTLQQLHAKYKS